MKSKKTDIGSIIIIFGMIISIIFLIFMGVKTDNINSNQKVIGYKNSYIIYNITEFNHDNIGHFCKEITPKGYELDAWWDGCVSTRDVIKFTCGYKNQDNARKYECHTLEELNNYLMTKYE